MLWEKYGKTPFDVFLKYLPKSYLNTFLSTELVPNENVVLEVVIENYMPTNPARVSCFALGFECSLLLVIFHPKPYHRGIFKPKAHLKITGKLQQQGAMYSIVQPKVLTNIGEFVVNFGCIGGKEKALREFAKTIHLELLQEYYPKVPFKILKSLFTIYQPDLAFIKSFEANGGFFGEFLEAIKFIEIYEYMRLLQSKKYHFKSIHRLNGTIDSWIKSLPFALTDGQNNAILDIKASFQGEYATRRVIMGDVGCGKTMVILASVLLAYPKRSILMAPTSVLAKQIFSEAKKFLPSHLCIGLLTQNSKEGDITTCDFAIGTHALLYQKLEDFALVMIDEQHRFGTAQRNMLEKMFVENKAHPHILQFSATPIPRTLAMIESSFLDFSFIKDLPFTKDITTTIITNKDFKTLLSHIESEITQKHQIIIVYPLVEQSEIMRYTSLSVAKDFWHTHFEGVYSTHGKDKNKEQILEEFREKGNILLATTLIEVGVSLPKLSTIIIVGAERLGLATLHQLRGRVSRNGLKGYCFLFTKQTNTERLERFAQTKDGFAIAQLDLQYRSGGDLLSGENQSGKQFRYIDLSCDEVVIQSAKKALEIG